MFKAIFVLSILLISSISNASLTRREEFEFKQIGVTFEAKFLYDATYLGKSTVIVVQLGPEGFPGRGDIPTDLELAERADLYAQTSYIDFKNEIDIAQPVKVKRKVAAKVVKSD